MSATNDNSPGNDPWWKGLVVAVIAALGGVAVALVTQSNPVKAEQPKALDTAVAPTPAPTSTLRITNLSSGGRVAFDPIVDGEASGSIEQVWLLIETRETPPNCWIQGPTGLDQDRTWHIRAQFGRSRSLDSGSRFSVSAIAGPPSGTRPGNVSCSIGAAVRSRSLEVTRR